MLKLLVWMGLVYFGFSVYSFSQVDPNLVLTQYKGYWTFQEMMWQLGYHLRLWSVVIYGLLLVGMYWGYIRALRFIKAGINPRALMWLWLTGIVALLPSYPAMSHDIFSYLINGKMAVEYSLNPREVAPIELSQEPWLLYTHNIQTATPYGPVWSWVEQGMYVLGRGHLQSVILWHRVWTIMMVGVVGMSVYVLSGKDKLYRTGLWLLNPLVMIEGINSLHNDATMMALFMAGLAGFVILRRKKKMGEGGIFLTLLWLLSVYTKLVTIVAPFVYMVSFGLRKLVPRVDYYGWLALVFTGLLFFDGSNRFYAWYLFWPLAVAVVSTADWIRNGMVWFTAAGLLSYSVYLFLGEYTQESYWMRVGIFFSLPVMYGLSKVWMKRKDEFIK
jgi:hypothetical protein